MTTSCLIDLGKSRKKRVQVPGEVEIGYQTQKRQSAEGRKGGIELEAKDSLLSLKMKKSRGIRSKVPWEESQVSVGGLLSLVYGSKGWTMQFAVEVT